MKVFLNNGTTLHVSPRKGNFSWLNETIISNDRFKEENRVKWRCGYHRYDEGPNGEPVYWGFRGMDLMYRDPKIPNRIWIRNRSGYIPKMDKERAFGYVCVCREGKWYMLENCGYIVVGPHKQKWWAIESRPFTEEESNGGIRPEIINCKKSSEGNAECWFE